MFCKLQMASFGFRLKIFSSNLQIFGFFICLVIAKATSGIVLKRHLNGKVDLLEVIVCCLFCFPFPTLYCHFRFSYSLLTLYCHFRFSFSSSLFSILFSLFPFSLYFISPFTTLVLTFSKCSCPISLGCFNHSTFANNPQFGITTRFSGTKLFVCLLQTDKRLLGKSVYDHAIGLSFVNAPKASDAPGVETPFKRMFAVTAADKSSAYAPESNSSLLFLCQKNTNVLSYVSKTIHRINCS